jgi:hypothetical protein
MGKWKQGATDHAAKGFRYAAQKTWRRGRNGTVYSQGADAPIGRLTVIAVLNRKLPIEN